MTRSPIQSWTLCCLAIFAFASCTSDTTTSENTGALSLNLELDSGVEIDEVGWTIRSPGMEDMSGTINTSAPGSTASVEVFGLPPGDDYNVELEATGEDGTTCRGDADFEVEVGQTEFVMVYLNCKRPQTLGGVRVNGKFNICAELAKVIVSPLQTSVGNDIDLSAIGQDVEDDAIEYLWTGTGGSVDDPNADETTYTCEELGKQLITVTVSDDDFDYCMHSWAVPVTCVDGDGLECTEDEDCEKGFVCEDFECVPEVECNEDSDCEMDEICLENKCVPDVECNEDSDCDEGFVCENFECVPDVECNDDADCGVDEVCVVNICFDDPDLFCNENLCEIDGAARADCIDTFLTCVALEPADEEGCAVLARLQCNECNEDSDCETGQVCNDDNVCEDGPDCSDVIDFEDACGPYTFNDFEGGVATVIDNPDQSGINTTAKVAQMQKFTGAPFGGSTLALDSAVDWTKGTAFTMKVWSPREVPVLFKLEGLNQERSDTQTGSSSWEELCYDFAGSTDGADATAITFIFDLGTVGDAEGDPDNWTFFFDGIVQTDSCGGGGGGELTTNGDFETGDISGWTTFLDPPNNGTFEATMEEKNGGLYSGKLVADPSVSGSTSFPVVKQANIGIGTVQPNSPITIRFDLFGSLAGAGGVVNVEFFSELSGGGTSKAEQLGGGPLFPTPPNDWTAGWVSYEFNTTTGSDVSGGVTLQLKNDCGANTTCNVTTYWDNVSVTVP